MLVGKYTTSQLVPVLDVYNWTDLMINIEMVIQTLDVQLKSVILESVDLV